VELRQVQFPLNEKSLPHDLVVSGALALPDGRVVRGEVGIVDGRIAALGEPGTLDGAERLDAPTGALVLPGHVDTHVHTRSEPGEGITRATTAAAAGGVTTLVDMPYDDPDAVTTVAAFERKLEDAEREAIVDVALWATIPKSGGLDEIPRLVEAGASAFKVSTFETHPTRFPRIPDGELLLAMERIREVGSLIAFHCENDEIVTRLSALLEEEGRTDPLAHADGRPPVTETEAIGRALELALATGVRVHIVHVTVERGFTLLERAKADGVDATGETCTHYLLLDVEEMVRQGGRAKINPPLRPRHEVENLWRLLAAGKIDWVTSDHVGWAREKKETENIFAAKSGVPALELTLPLLYSEGVVNRALPLQRLLQVLCERPAQRFGLWPRKGAIALGADADLVLFDPEARWRVDEAELVAYAGWSPYHGRDVTGRVLTTLVRGRRVFDRGEVVGVPGQGVIVRPHRREPAPALA
jgi:allantoinase